MTSLYPTAPLKDNNPPTAMAVNAPALDGSDDLIRSGLAEAARSLTQAQRDALATAPLAVQAGAALNAAENRAAATGPFAGKLPIGPNVAF